MSSVTNLVLSLPILESEVTEGKIVEVNRFFKDYGSGLVSLVDASLPVHWYGGGKALEVELYVGAYNHLDLNAFIAHLRSIEWDFPEEVQVIVKEQHDKRFRLINVFDDRG